jgi:hypothetical protein
MSAHEGLLTNRMSRRDFLAAASALSTLVLAPPRRATAEPLPEVKHIRIGHLPAMMTTITLLTIATSSSMSKRAPAGVFDSKMTRYSVSRHPSRGAPERPLPEAGSHSVRGAWAALDAVLMSKTARVGASTGRTDAQRHNATNPGRAIDGPGRDGGCRLHPPVGERA